MVEAAPGTEPTDESAEAIFITAARAPFLSAAVSAQLEAAHAAAVEEAVTAARCEAIEEAAVRFAQERTDEAVSWNVIAELKEQHEATLAASATRIRETEERVRKEEREAAAAALSTAVAAATVRMKIDHGKASADAHLELSMRYEKSKAEAVEAASVAARDEVTNLLSAKQRARIAKLESGIAESDESNEARHKALEEELQQANEALRLTLDRITGRKKK